MIWSDSDLNNYVQSVIRQTVSASDELKAARLSRKTNPTDEELEFIAMVDSAITKAIEGGKKKMEEVQCQTDIIPESPESSDSSTDTETDTP